jgi:hypothetical protein
VETTIAQVIELFSTANRADVRRRAARRLKAISSSLSFLDLSGLQTQDDARRALCVLELAGQFVHSVLAVLREDDAGDELIRKGEELIASVDLARRLLSADTAGQQDGTGVKVVDRNLPLSQLTSRQNRS